jgi:hypothetical protein
MARGERKMKNQLQRVKEYFRVKGKRKKESGVQKYIKESQGKGSSQGFAWINSLSGRWLLYRIQRPLKHYNSKDLYLQYLGMCLHGLGN